MQRSSSEKGSFITGKFESFVFATSNSYKCHVHDGGNFFLVKLVVTQRQLTCDIWYWPVRVYTWMDGFLWFVGCILVLGPWGLRQPWTKRSFIGMIEKIIEDHLMISHESLAMPWFCNAVTVLQGSSYKSPSVKKSCCSSWLLESLGKWWAPRKHETLESRPPEMIATAVFF